MPCDSPYTIILKQPIITSSGVQFSCAVPCGKCGVCRKNKVDEWSFRLRQESKTSDSAMFVTLTYDPEHIPRSENNMKTLNRDDITGYFKRLRKWMQNDDVLNKPLKFYLVGEYGEENARPHYHVILFNATREHTVESWCKVPSRLRRKDASPLGLMHIGDVTSDSIAYCVKYLDKGRTVPLHARDDRTREFSRMSHRLGQNYLTPEMIAWHKADPSRNYIQDGEYKIALPRFYREQIYTNAEKAVQRSLCFQKQIDTESKNMLSYFDTYPNHTESDYYLDLEFQKQSRFKKHTHGKNRK